MGRRADVASEYYRIYTPIDVPLGFCRDGYYRLAARAECKKCGRGFVQILRGDRFRNALGIELANRKPDPHDEKVMTQLMLAVCNHGVGDPRLHRRGCEVGAVKRTGKFQLTGTQSTRMIGGPRVFEGHA